MNSLYKSFINTEIGEMIAVASEKGICLLDFADNKLLDKNISQLKKYFKADLIYSLNNPLINLKVQLEEYFKGERTDFDISLGFDLPHLSSMRGSLLEFLPKQSRRGGISLDLVGTEFQKKVWISLLNIPYGQTISYTKQAENLGIPTAVRAVANANGKNKISIILPCHRVIGSDGRLTGYAGGIWRKKKLLEMEFRHKL